MSAFSSSRMLVSGVSGPIGAALLPSLRSCGFQVVRLVRHSAEGADQIQWDPARSLAANMVSGFDSVIHLAGESVVGRWTNGKKAKIRDTRLQGTHHLASSLAAAKERPRVLITASAIGYYGNRGDETLREESRAGAG